MKPSRLFMVPRAIAASLMLLAWVGVASAQTFLLDDSTSPRARVIPRAAVDETGKLLSRSLEPNRAILRFGEVVYRLDMRPHLAQTARDYFVRQPEVGQPTGSLLHWSTGKGSLKGSLQSGERALVWSGIVNQDWLELSMQLELDFDLMRRLPNPKLGNTNQVTYFELER